MDLKILNRPLTRQQIDFKVAQVIKTKDDVRANILAYKDARVDMQVLDEACGQLGWQCTYQRDTKGILQCSIGLWDEEKKQWIWKTSNGIESDFESEKGEYSDAFKRAGFMWGIGRQLYDFPQISVILNENDYYEKDGKVKASGWLRPNFWKWTISDDYKTVTAERKFEGKLVEVYNSNPYKK
jgi:hypothetical protein